MTGMDAISHLPTSFCWTRIGTEAGQPLHQILRRKEEERRANDGVFLWGIGNAVGPGIQELVRTCETPEVLFSPIVGSPRRVDSDPESVVAWTTGQTGDGREFQLPTHSLVTSRQSVSSPKVAHYALVCSCQEPLGAHSPVGSFSFNCLRNLLSGNPVGASQVTAVVARNDRFSVEGRIYEVALRARLVYPYFIRLRHPVSLSVVEGADAAWATMVKSVWNQKVGHGLLKLEGQGLLPL
jgi:hypothetical protein